jgi:hypothetical protein
MKNIGGTAIAWSDGIWTFTSRLNRYQISGDAYSLAKNFSAGPLQLTGFGIDVMKIKQGATVSLNDYVPDPR